MTAFLGEEEERFALCANVPLIARDKGAMNGAHKDFPSPPLPAGTLPFVIPEGNLRLLVCSTIDQIKVPNPLLTTSLLEANSHRLNILREK
jgi:hypothetical protein